MTQEDKMLLIKDLSSRLPYAVHVQHTSGFSGTLHNISMYHEHGENDNVYDIICYTDFFGDGDSITIEHFKPYLFPLSSMTEEEQRTLDSMCNGVEMVSRLSGLKMFDKAFNWLNENHFDYRGLIEKGLAIDATGLNIY